MNYPQFPESIVGGSGSFSPLRSVLFDGVTGLPTLALVMESLKDAAAEQKRLGIICIDTMRLEPLEEEYGWEMVDTLLGHVRTFLDSNASRFSPLKLFCVHRMIGDNFLIVLSPSDASKPLSSSDVSQVSAQLEEKLNEYLAVRLPPAISPFARVFSGYSILEHNSNVRFERLISRAINRAYQGAISQQERTRQMQIQQLQEILNNDQIRILFQPILKLENRDEVLGQEALSRGPEGSLFEAAEFMFSLAAHCGLLHRLENLCQLRLISTLEKAKDSQLIFVNLEPSFLEQNQFEKLALFSSTTIPPHRVVIEITERVAIRDYELVTRALESIRKRGFRIAVDDVGSGYASLQSIAYLKPDFIKISEKMVQGISSDFIKQEIIKTLRDLASRFSASLIAEGIENEEDLKTLLELKVPFGQGFLLQRPVELLLG